MVHLKDSPPGEIVTLLQGANLSDCGVSKWDASFVEVEKETLLVLRYAVSVPALGSMSLLADALATPMMKGKSADKIQRGFGLLDDLPAREESHLSEARGELRKRQSAPVEEGGLSLYQKTLRHV